MIIDTDKERMLSRIYVLSVSAVLLCRMTPIQSEPPLSSTVRPVLVKLARPAAASVVHVRHASLMQCVTNCMSLQQTAFCAKAVQNCIDNMRWPVKAFRRRCRSMMLSHGTVSILLVLVPCCFLVCWDLCGTCSAAQLDSM